MMSNPGMAEIGPRHAGQWPRRNRAQQGRQQARQRAHQIKFLQYVGMGLMTLSEAARALQISDSTIDRLKQELLNDGEPDTDDLRKLAIARKHWKDNK